MILEKIVKKPLSAHTDNNRNQMLDLLKVIAIFLVFNSHCDALYPNPIFATGGAAGNSLFFIISGYFLKYNENFIHWYLRKISRIYLPVALMTVLSYGGGYTQ